VQALSLMNVFLIAAWLLLVVGIGRSYRALIAQKSSLAS